MHAKKFIKHRGIITVLDIFGTKSYWSEDKAQLFMRKIEEIYKKLDETITKMNYVYSNLKKLISTVEIGDKIIDDKEGSKNLVSVFIPYL